MLGKPPASGTASERFSARGCKQPSSETGCLTEVRLASVDSPTGRIAGLAAEQPQDRFSRPPWHAATLAPRSDSAGGAAAGAKDVSSGPVDAVDTSAHSSPSRSARYPPSARAPVADRGGRSGHGHAPFRVPSIRSALQDLAVFGDGACHSSPVEQVLARRKRRRRANFGVSTALSLSACTDEAPLPPMPGPLRSVTREDREHSGVTVRALCDELEGLDLR